MTVVSGAIATIWFSPPEEMVRNLLLLGLIAVWVSGWWLVSPELAKRSPLIRTSYDLRTKTQIIRKEGGETYRRWQILPILFIVATCLFFGKVLNDQRLAKERSLVFSSLDVPSPYVSGSTEIENIEIGLKNNDPKIDLDVKRLSCQIVSAVWENGSTLHNGVEIDAPPGKLEHGGDGMSADCLKHLIKISAPTVCVDLKIHALYTLADQPETIQEKPFRYVGKLNGNGFLWSQVQRNSSDNCEEIEQRAKKRNRPME